MAVAEFFIVLGWVLSLLYALGSWAEKRIIEEQNVSTMYKAAVKTGLWISLLSFSLFSLSMLGILFGK